MILVPSYQNSNTIEQTLLSIQEQAVGLQVVREVIIADDASSDRTVAAAYESWSSATPLRVIRRCSNLGEYRNVNETVAKFDPDIEWFLILHSDDIAKPEWLNTLLANIATASDRIASISTSYDSLRLDGEVTKGENDRPETVVLVRGTSESVAGTLKKGCWWHISGCAIRVSAFRAVGGLPEDLRTRGDWDFLLRLLIAGWDVVYIPQSVMVYRENVGSSSSISTRTHA